MKILAVSDQVDPQLHNAGIKTRLADIGLILGCGDLPAHYLDFLASTLNVPLFYVVGNHDYALKQPPSPFVRTNYMPKTVFGGTNLDERVIGYQGLLIGGLEGSMRYNRAPGAQYTEGEMMRKIWRMVPHLLWNRLRHGRYLDLLITHAPPKGIHDRRDLCHTGFNAFLWLMDRFPPRYLLHGHIHAYNSLDPTETRYGLTQVINVYPHRVLDVLPL